MTEARADESASTDGEAPDAESDARLAYDLHHLRPDPLEIPRLAPDVEPIGGVIRAEIEDFEVEEIPLYRPSGEGEHVYLTIRKRNRTTLQIRQFLSQVLGVKDEDIGFAGFKDKRGITTQAFSVLGIEEERVERIHPAEWIEVLEVGRHGNKLRPGHLEGNKFKIRVREARAGSIDDARRIVDCVRERGLPNFYHGQRFGRGYVGARTGHALIHRDVDRVVGLLVGNEAGVPEPFRDAFEAGDVEKALELLPPGRAAEAAILHALRRYPDNNRAAARRIPRQLRKMYFSAYQSFLYNWALRERWSWGGEPHQLYGGDVAQKTDTGGIFTVVDTPEEIDEANRRARDREIVPTGPIFGRKMRFAEAKPGAMEWAILAEEGLRPQSFLSHVKGLKIDGTRRKACVWVDDVKVTEEAPDTFLFEFSLPPGCYATTLLEQVMGPFQVNQLPSEHEEKQ